MNDLPTLYHLGKNGALYSWRVWTEGATIKGESGQVDGQVVPFSKEATAKNAGRANATTAEEQAIKEAQAMHKHKLDRKYSLTPEDARVEEIAPMLAHPIEKKMKKLVFPADMQPKLDGARCLAFWEGDRVVLMSRGYQEWTVPQHINRELEQVLPKGSILDGELYKHGVPLQTLVNSWMKKRLPESATIEYHVYDMPSHQGNDTMTWEERKVPHYNFFAEHGDRLKMVKYVPDFVVYDYDDILAHHDELVEQGFEGGIVRLRHGLYEYGYRSSELLKVKAFEDHEYKVVGATNGKGKFADCAIFKCVTDDGKSFEVTAPGTIEEKQAYLRDAEQYFGSLLTVQHMGFTKDGIPWHPVAKLFRPTKDLG